MISTIGSDKRGFSLLELLVVLLLLGLGSLIVLPSVDKGLKGYEARRSALELGAFARHLRSRALFEGRPKHLIIDPSSNSYQASEGTRVSLPPDIGFQGIEGGEPLGNGIRQFIFYPNGSILGGQVGILGRKGSPTYIIHFDPLSGRIEVVRNA